ncbi:MAG: S4 domain-containing protein, partial [Pseudomonadota bacterium]
MATREHLTENAPSDAFGPSIRADKWLWYTRIVKSRSLAATLVSGGKVRVNREKITKP